MSMFDLKGGSSGNGWNYHDNTKSNYMEMIEGTVVEISNPQSINFNTKQPETWPDGNPKRNLRIAIRGRSGQELSWTFSPKSKGAEACLAALDPQGTREQVSIEELLGKFVRVQTQGGVYNAQHPRPWWVTILGDGEANMVRGLVDLSKQQSSMPGMPAPQPAPVQQAAPAPAIQPVQVAQPMQQPMQQQPASMTPLQQAQQKAQAAVANQNFQQVNAAPPVSQVPVETYDSPAEEYYASDIPF